jgi:hypothetical protein
MWKVVWRSEEEGWGKGWRQAVKGGSTPSHSPLLAFQGVGRGEKREVGGSDERREREREREKDGE